MSVFEHPDTLKLLQDLLKPPDESSDSEDDDFINNSNKKFGPGDVGSKSTTTKTDTSKTSSTKEDIKSNEDKNPLPKSDDIDEIDKWLENQEKADVDILETRKVPKYEIIFKQAVGTEDVFLQMNNRTGASMSCEDMVIKIEMPEETVDVDEMDLSVTEKDFDLKTPIYRLKIPLIHEVDPNKGNAGYDTESKILTITLRMKREYDFVNF